MRILLLVLIFKYVMHQHVSRGFNIDTKFPIIFEDPQKISYKTGEDYTKYFGFASALVHNSTGHSWIYIGAPCTKDSNDGYQNNNNKGIVYMCSVAKELKYCEEYKTSANDCDVSNQGEPNEFWCYDVLNNEGEKIPFEMPKCTKTRNDKIWAEKFGTHQTKIKKVNNNEVLYYISRNPGKNNNKGGIEYGSKLDGDSKNLNGFSEGSYFGAAVVSLHDINKDEYPDIAIGAPYEQNGSIYICYGDSTGFSRERCQHIRAEDISPEIRGFGCSFSQPKDIDHNGYFDVAVGAFLSGHTVLLRARPVVTLNTSLTPIGVNKIGKNITEFSVETCVSFDKNKIKTPLNVLQTLLVDERGYFTQTEQAEGGKAINVDGHYCETFKIGLHLQKARTSNRLEPFTVVVNYSLIDQMGTGNPVWVRNGDTASNDGFDGSYPVEDQLYKKDNETLKIYFETGCANNDKCNASLKLKCTFIDVRDNKHTIDSSKPLRQKISILNKGPDPAYGAKIRIIYSKKDIIIPKLKTCDVTKGEVICNLQEQLKIHQTDDLFLNIDLRNISDVKEPLNVSIQYKLPNENWSTEQNFSIHLITEADVSITGYSTKETYIFSETSGDQQLVSFSHIYEVQKLLRSPIFEAEVKFLIPYSYQKESKKENIVNTLVLHVEQDDNPPHNFNNFLKENKMPDGQHIKTGMCNEDTKSSCCILNTTISSSKKGNNSLLGNSSVININCDESSSFLCILIKCKTKQLYTREEKAKFTLEMIVNSTQIVSLFGKMDFDVKFTTKGGVHITRPEFSVENNDKKHNTEITTPFSSGGPQKGFQGYIIAISVIAGIVLILLPIIIGLWKGGFFKKKQEFNNLEENITRVSYDGMYATPNSYVPNNHRNNIQDKDQGQVPQKAEQNTLCVYAEVIKPRKKTLNVAKVTEENGKTSFADNKSLKSDKDDLYGYQEIHVTQETDTCNNEKEEIIEENDLYEGEKSPVTDKYEDYTEISENQRSNFNYSTVAKPVAEEELYEDPEHFMK